MHLGAHVACIELQNNIINYGGFDRHDFLLGCGGNDDDDIIEYIESQGWDRQKILIYDGALPLDRLRKNNYHVIHVHDVELGRIISLRHTLRMPLAPATAINHTISYTYLMARWMDLLLGHVLPCDAIICTSRASREVIERSFMLLSERLAAQADAKAPAFPGLLPVIPLGVDTEYWRPEEDKAKAKRSMELPEDSCTILCPARFSTSDKMDLRPLLMAVQRLMGIFGTEGFRLVLVGDDLRAGEGESKLIQDFVDKLGLTQVVKIDTDGKPSRIRQYYGAADIFVSLVDNVQETFGLTVTQAMACGLPAIVSDWNGYKDTVVHDETGIRVRTYWAQCDDQISNLGGQRAWEVDHLLLAQSVAVDIEELFYALYRLVRDPAMRCRLGEAGRTRAEQLYAWPVVVRQYRELWEECHERFNCIDVHEWQRQDYGATLAPAYFRQFSHYASEVVSVDTQLILPSAGKELASAPDPVKEVLLPAAMRTVFHPAIFQSLMSQLSDWPVSFGSLLEKTSYATGHSQDQVARQVMWLMKYGIVKPVEAVPNAISVSAESALA